MTTQENEWSLSESSSVPDAQTSTPDNTEPSPYSRPNNPTPSRPRLISNSEVQAWNTCRRQYYYAHDLSIAPKHFGPALTLGIAFHDCIKHYYQAIKDGEPRNAAMLKANDAVRHYAQRDAITASKVQIMMLNYFGFYTSDGQTWEVIEVEESHEIPLTENYFYTMREDLLMRHLPTGEFWLWDHKTTYDFWSEDDFGLSLQFPKYIGTLKFHGVDIAGIIVNQIRTREKKNPSSDDLFRRTPVRYNAYNVQRALREQIVSAQEITGFRNLPPQIREQHATRIGNKMVCRMCSFKPPCIAELRGEDITYLLETEYGPNTYDQGYNPIVDKAGDW